jgi:hypothetical protein
MDSQKTGLAVLARIPDLNDGEHHTEAEQPRGLRLLASSGRLIGQAASIKLLAGMTLFLLVGAVLPFCISKTCPPEKSPPAMESLATWEPQSAKALAEVGGAKSETAPTNVASGPAARIPAAAERLSAPLAVPPTAEANSKPQAVPSVAESLMSSTPWPTPAHAETDTNRPAVRSTEYEADARARNGQRAPDAHFEGTIEGTRR